MAAGRADAPATALAAEYGVSRTTARAGRVLAEEGRVTVLRNWGAFVALSPPSSRQAPTS